MFKKIAIIGPESTGKTHLCNSLCKHFNAGMVEEYAREYLNARGGHYVENDLISIAKGQINFEEKASSKGHNFLFCDTNLLVIKIWSLYKYGRCHQKIMNWWNQSHYDLHLLLQTDLPYESDPLRENPRPEERMELFALYEQELKSSDAKYAVIEGQGEDRIEVAISVIKQYFFV